MKTSKPLVSVIIPTYNYAIYIIEAIENILIQDYPTELTEIIVVDDGSLDNTKEVLQPYIDRNIVKYYYQANSGKASATYSAIQKSTGKYIFNLDADDFFLAGKISLTVDVFESDEKIAHVASPAKFIIDGKDQGKEEIKPDLLNKAIDGEELLDYFYNNMLMYGGGSTFAARASVLKNIYISKEVDMYIDEFLVVAVLNKGASYFISEPLSIWRGHNNNYTYALKKVNAKNKNNRLDASSDGVFELISKGDYSPKFKKLYSLRHETRRIYFKELDGTKTLKDIGSYFTFCFFKNRFKFSQLRAYSIYNRLLPLFLINLLKHKR